MSGVYPSNHSMGVRLLRLCTAVWFWIVQMYWVASNHISGGAPLMLSKLLVRVLVSLQALSAKFWLPTCGSLCQSLIQKVRKMSLTCSDSCARALSLISLSIAPYFLISSIRAFAKYLSVDPQGTIDRKCDLRPTKNWAAVDPLSIACVWLYKVSVATSSLRRGRFRTGLGDVNLLRSVIPVVAPRVPNCVVDSNVRLMLSRSAPGK